MRRDARATTAGSTKSRGGSFGDFVRGALAARVFSSRVDGSGAPVGGTALLSSLAVLAGLLLALSGTASAAITHNPEPFSPLDGSGSGLTLQEPRGIAIDEATGNVFVTDGTVGRGFEELERVAILGSEGGAPTGLAAPYEIPGLPFYSGENGGIAYDNSPTSPARGTLYVRTVQATSIKKYVRNEVSETYELAGEIVPPTSAQLSYLSVDGDGNLYVNDHDLAVEGGLGWIYKFDPNGDLVAEYSGLGPSNSPGFLGDPGPTAANDEGDLFFSEGDALYEIPAGTPSGHLDPTDFRKVLKKGGAVAFDPVSGHLYVARLNQVIEYDPASDQIISEFGAGVIGEVGQVAVDSSTNRIYVADNGGGGNAEVDVFGPAVTVPTIKIGAASDVTGTRATLNGSVNPEGLPVTDCFFEWGETDAYGQVADCDALPGEDSEVHPVSADLTGLAPNGATYHFRLVAQNENGIERSADKSFVTADTVATEAATDVAAAGGTLHGLVRPEGLPYTACKFEYGLTTSAGFEEESSCVPSAEEIGADFSAHAVSASVSNLKSNSTYKFRLTATNSDGTLSGETLIFTTLGPPQISEIRALNADRTSVTLEAKINPSGFGTSYHFEWGPTTSYGHDVPAEFEPFVGSGSEPVRVSAKVPGLAQAATYHYRIVASSKAGTSKSPDQVFETLNSCGLPENRCFELVSPRDAGPVATPGQVAAQAELHYQAATQPGSLAYVVESGLPDATKGAEVLYHGTRLASGWRSTQLSAPMISRNESNVTVSWSATMLGLSDDLSCGILESNQPLAGTASSRLVLEAGGTNLYRRNADGSYAVITALPPEDPAQKTGYGLQGFSQDCGTVVFETQHHYSGVPGVNSINGERLYEWDEGTLRGIGFVPGPSGEEAAVTATAGTRSNHSRAVSEDGSRIFLSAERKASDNPEEVGAVGIFVRENGTVRDLSLSETATPNTGSTYQYATKDGSKVFFTANAGLTDESSAGGTDLYEYDLKDDRLVDLSVGPEPGKAEVAGVLGASGDGSRVYFAARGQLDPGMGKTLGQNQAAKTYSVYGAEDGKITYAGTVTDQDLGGRGVTVAKQSTVTSRVSEDGRYLLYQSTSNVTGYESGGAVEAYLFDFEANADALTCISCRQDGDPSITPNGNEPLHSEGETNPLYAIPTLTVTGGAPRVYFTSFDRLTPGAAEGRTNIYLWSHEQVFLVAAEPPDLAGPPQVHESEGQTDAKGFEIIRFLGASADGTDLYLSTPQTLNWEDGDSRPSVYTARIGGGFPEPPPSAPPCDPVAEGSCQSPGAPASLSLPAPGSSSFTGSGNAKPKQSAPKRGKKKKSHGKKGGRRKGKNGEGKHRSKRNASANRRAGK